MINYRVEIEIIGGGSGTINTVTLPVGNNISSFNGGSYANSDISRTSNGDNPFIFGASILGGGDTYSTKYKGYLSSVKADINGNSDFSMTISGSNIADFTINFDTVANQYATEIYVNNILYYNDDTQFTWKSETALSAIPIRFAKWNKSNYPIRFTSIIIGLTLEYTKFNGLLSFVRGSQSMSDNTYPTYGAIAQYGSVSISDYNTTLADLEEMGLLKSGTKIKFFVDNEQVGDYLWDTFTKDMRANTYTIDLTDEIVKWNDILVEKVLLKTNQTALDFYNFLISKYEANYEPLSSELSEWIASINIGYFYLNSGTLFEQWNKFCDLTQCLVYKNEEGQICVRRLE